MFPLVLCMPKIIRLPKPKYLTIGRWTHLLLGPESPEKQEQIREFLLSIHILLNTLHFHHSPHTLYPLLACSFQTLSSITPITLRVVIPYTLLQFSFVPTKRPYQHLSCLWGWHRDWLSVKLQWQASKYLRSYLPLNLMANGILHLTMLERKFTTYSLTAFYNEAMPLHGTYPSILLYPLAIIKHMPQSFAILSNLSHPVGTHTPFNPFSRACWEANLFQHITWYWWLIYKHQLSQW